MDDLLPPADQLLASAIHYLIQGDEKDAALILLFCEAACPTKLVPPVFSKSRSDITFHVFLVGPRVAYEAFNRWESRFEDGMSFTVYPIQSAVKEAFDAIAPPGSTCAGVDMRVQLIDIQPGWREEL